MGAKNRPHHSSSIEVKNKEQLMKTHICKLARRVTITYDPFFANPLRVAKKPKTNELLTFYEAKQTICHIYSLRSLLSFDAGSKKSSFLTKTNFSSSHLKKWSRALNEKLGNGKIEIGVHTEISPQNSLFSFPMHSKGN